MTSLPRCGIRRPRLFAAIGALPLAAASGTALAAGALDTGNTAWMLTATALVLFMALPGLALFYSGLTRASSALSVMMQAFRHRLPGVPAVVRLRLQPGIRRRRCKQPVDRRIRQPVPCGTGPRQPLGHRPGIGVRHVPDDLRHHRAGAGGRQLHPAHALPGPAVVRGAVADLRVLPGRALGVGRRLAGGVWACWNSPAAWWCTCQPAWPAWWPPS